MTTHATRVARTEHTQKRYLRKRYTLTRPRDALRKRKRGRRAQWPALLARLNTASMTVPEIARATGKSETATTNALLRYGAPYKHRKGGVESAVAWASLDWSLPDTSIALLMGVSRERARQVRAKLGKPKTESLNTTRSRERAERAARLAGTHTTAEIAERLRISPGMVWRYLHARGLRAVNPRKGIRRVCWKYDWDAVDWANKFDTQIARELGCSPVTVLHTRKRQGRPAGPDGRRVSPRRFGNRS